MGDYESHGSGESGDRVADPIFGRSLVEELMFHASYRLDIGLHVRKRSLTRHREFDSGGLLPVSMQFTIPAVNDPATTIVR